MALNINGTTGISGVDGSASAPALTGTDSNTGINFGSDILAFNVGGSEKARFHSNGKCGIGITAPNALLHVNENNASQHFQLSNSTNANNFTAFGVDTSFNLRLYVNGSNERMRTLSTGRFLFGRTTEFVMGSDAVDYQFEQITNDTAVEIENDIVDTFQIWLPFVDLQNIDVDLSDQNRNKIKINITFNVRNAPTELQSVGVVLE